MRINDEYTYRMKLVEEFLSEARQDLELGRWRSCVDNSQLIVENSAKTALALVGPVGHTHSPDIPLRQALVRGDFPAEMREIVRQLVDRAELLGADVLAKSDYGDTVLGRTPWEILTNQLLSVRCKWQKKLFILQGS
ncbi:MAG: HEPN domain-containing protein [Candidatus Brachytrichaceae bacterium NZ_4S206]|jgi:HEPN domain-containing protein